MWQSRGEAPDPRESGSCVRGPNEDNRSITEKADAVAHADDAVPAAEAITTFGGRFLARGSPSRAVLDRAAEREVGEPEGAV